MGKGSTHYWFLGALFLSLLFHLENAEKQKRQIFREQVLPSRGGKIPEEAFRADRLALNRLNKEGISIPDGVILDARHIHKHPNPPSKMPEVLKVFLTPEDRYVPPEGRYINERPKSVDTTYLVRHPVGSKEGAVKFGRDYNSLGFYQPPRPRIYTPLPVPLIIPTRERVEFRQSKNFYPTWTPDYTWRIIYEPNFNDYFVKSVAVFNSHQTINYYDGFFDDFYERSIRHVESGCESNWRKKFNERNSQPFSKDDEDLSKKKIRKSETMGYPSLKEIPVTGFACGDNIGTFADPETGCQVFHQCTTAGKNSFLCSEGTIFSEVKKRCEWSNTVSCGNGTIDH